MSSDRFAALSPEQLELLRLLLAEEGLDPARLPIPRAPRPGGRAPASYAQQRLWFLHQLAPESPRYNLPIAVELRGALAPGALAAAMGDVVRRHEMLRTRFAADDGRPAQVVLDALPARALPLPWVDLSGLPAAERQPELHRLLAACIDLPFDLSQAPLHRATLFRLDHQAWVMLLVAHHIIADAWSMSIWVEEAAAAYRARSLGEPSALPPLAVQYADFAHWQRRRLAGPLLDREADHWRQRLDGLLPIALPADRPRGAAVAHRRGMRRALLARPLAAALHALARRRGVTLFVTLAAALDLLLARYCGSEDIAIGTPVAG
ncbi:MAG TPA: condensation domain-containing protein, partial [Thermoanaerobaculia bacterium]